MRATENTLSPTMSHKPTATRKAHQRPAKRPQRAAVNLSELSRQHGVSRETLRLWRDEGIDLADAGAVAARIAIMRGKSTDETLAEAKRRRAIADANRAEIQAQKEADLLMPVAEARAACEIIGFVFKSCLKNAAGVWPGMLAGLSAEQMHVKLKELFHELLDSLHRHDPAKLMPPDFANLESQPPRRR
jgi:hypothetical protein